MASDITCHASYRTAQPVSASMKDLQNRGVPDGDVHIL
jgi:hypothetical protein